MKSLLVVLFSLLSALAAEAFDVPPGYQLQVLEPLGGKIAKPQDWLYFQSQHGPILEWVISREDIHQGPYQTGLKIQLFADVLKGTGQTPQQFCQAFLDSKRTKTTVLNSFPVTSQGIFMRQGLEVEENLTHGIETQRYHLIYSVFWTNTDTDIGVITSAGTPVDLWPRFQETFNVMSHFELIDMSRFSNTPAANSAPAPTTNAPPAPDGLAH